MTAPDRIYCDTYLGSPMYAYKNHHDIPTRIPYIRADKANAALEQLKGIQAYIEATNSDNSFLMGKVLAAIKHLEP